jgi:hypothetical protein
MFVDLIYFWIVLENYEIGNVRSGELTTPPPTLGIPKEHPKWR